jgi:hypothetical protein
VKHVAPQRWADLWAGRVDDAERTSLERHAAACPKCARERERVTRASDSFVAIKSQTAPELAWDSVRAKVHWSVSTERRAKVAVGSSNAGWIAFGVTAAAAVATMFVERPVPPSADGPAIAMGVPRVEAPAKPLAGLVNRTTGDLMIDGLRPADPFRIQLAAGNVIATGDGRVDVQFGDRSAFGLGPHSRLELVRFDSHAIELVVDGTIDVEVGPRAADQRFTIRAGRREIEVRGTQFQVTHDKDTTAVACRHGLVAVRDAGGQREVGAARRLVLPSNKPVLGETVTTLSIDQVTELADATPLSMPLWDLGTLANSAPLDIATAGRRAVRVDGVELGEAPMRVRVMPGRHTVETVDHQGRYRRAGWVDVVAGAKRPARVEILPEPPATPVRGIDERRRQLKAGIDRGKIAACTRAAAKQGLVAGAYVQIEISVDATGAVNFLNILETDLSRKLSDCIEGVLKDVTFRAGPAASWRERIDL